MKILLTCLILCLCIASGVVAQGVINTDRPTNTYSPSIVPKGNVVLESGVLLSWTSQEGSDKSRYYDFGQTYVRIGTGANLEIQVATSVARSQPSPALDAVTGFTPLKLGGKMRLMEEKGFWPEMSFIGNITLPWIGKEEFRPEYIAPDFRFIFLHSLSEHMSLGYNLGMVWNGIEPNSSFVYSLMVARAVVGDLTAFAEVYGSFPEGSASTHAYDLGLTYLVSNDFQLDLSFGNTYTDPTGIYINAGAAFRFGSTPED